MLAAPQARGHNPPPMTDAKLQFLAATRERPPVPPAPGTPPCLQVRRPPTCEAQANVGRAPSARRRNRHVLAVLACLASLFGLAGVGGLTGCAQPPVAQGGPAGKAQSAPKPAAEPVAAPAPAAEPAPAPPPAPEPIAQGELREAIRSLQDLLQNGDIQAAAVLARRILATEPGHALVQSYLRQIESDPVELLGRDSYPYTVRPGDSLSSIARDRMRDVNLFFALARYNGIEIPRHLAAGQVIRIPGRAPAPSAIPAAAPAAPAPAAAPAAASAPVPPAAEASAPAPSPAAPPAATSAAANTKKIAALMREARTANARQDPCLAVRQYDAVLAIDAAHAQAQLERQRSLDLIVRLRARGSKLDC